MLRDGAVGWESVTGKCWCFDGDGAGVGGRDDLVIVGFQYGGLGWRERWKMALLAGVLGRGKGVYWVVIFALPR